MTQEALKLLQEVLAGLKDVEKQVHELVAENKALKEALAQPDQYAKGNWINAEDVSRNVKALDIALNGEGAASSPLLIDVLGQVQAEARRIGKPVLKALAQPEPVMHTLNCVCGAVWDIKTDGSEEMVHTPYTTPPPRKPLTDEQKMALCKQFPNHLTFNAIHAIEASHGIKE